MKHGERILKILQQVLVVKRYDGTGEPHFNKVTKERLLPHVHDKTVPGDVRSPIPLEVPIRGNNIEYIKMDTRLVHSKL